MLKCFKITVWFRTNLISFRNFRRPLFPKPVSWLGLFCRFFQQDGSSFHIYLMQARIWNSMMAFWATSKVEKPFWRIFLLFWGQRGQWCYHVWLGHWGPTEVFKTTWALEINKLMTRITSFWCLLYYTLPWLTLYSKPCICRVRRAAKFVYLKAWL